MKHDLDPLFEYCTVRQCEILEAVILHGSNSEAARRLGVAHQTVSEAIRSIKAKAAPKLISAHADPEHIPEGFAIKGTSTLRKDASGMLQWVKTDRSDAAAQKALMDFANALGESVAGLAPITPAPKHTSDDLLSVYPMGDPHIGMYAWWQDAGADFDLEIAERLTKAAIDRLVASGPASSTALLLNLGDMFHADDQSNTSKSGHQLDVDGRWAKVLHVGLMCMVHCVMRLLGKHQKVIVRVNKGNHDGHSSYALAVMLSCWFRNEPRVVIDLSPAVTWYYRFGKVLLGSTHGDTIKGPNMVGLMAADRPEDWGLSVHRYWYVGHVHHKDVKEYPGGIVEFLRTLAARDAWHAGQGYRAGRDMCLIVHHKDHGEIERHRCDISMIS